MYDVGVLSWNNFLHEHSHIHLMQTDADLLCREEGSFVEFTCPHSLDRLPSLIKCRFSDAETQQLFSKVSVHRIRRLEVQFHNQIFALIEKPVHLFDALANLSQAINNGV